MREAALQHEPGERLGGLAAMVAVRALGADADVADIVVGARYALDRFVAEGRLPDPEDRRAAVATLLGRMWQGLGREGVGPDRYEAREWWLGVFREVGWIHTWARAPKPVSAFGVVRLFRGAVPGRRDGIAWTDSVELAAWFARRAGDGARVWQVSVPADRLLCAFPIEVGGALRAVEFIVDAEGLVVEPVGGGGA